MRSDDRLVVDLQFPRTQRPRQFAADELLVARDAVDLAFVRDDRAGTFLRRLAQRQFGAMREFAARRGMARRLRQPCMRAQTRTTAIDPVRARDSVDCRAQHRLGIDLAARR